MLHISSRLSICGLLLCTTGFLACDRTTEPDTPPGTVSLSLSQTGGTVDQGSEIKVNAILVRSGSYAGVLALRVTGAPAGVTTFVSAGETSGATTVLVVRFTTVESVTPGVYPIILTGVINGVSQADADYQLTVIEAPNHFLTPATAAITVAQGASMPMTITIGRFTFSGDVFLSAIKDDAVSGDHCGCLPEGVTATFSPNPAVAASVLTMAVGNAVPKGSYQLMIIGEAVGSTSNRRFSTALLTLTVN
jgi:hypothetical protein